MSYGYLKSSRDRAVLKASVQAVTAMPAGIREDICTAIDAITIKDDEVIVVEANGHHSYTHWMGDGSHQYKVKSVALLSTVGDPVPTQA